MDRIDCDPAKYAEAPWRVEDAEILQDQTRLLADAIGGDAANVIMKGCVVSGTAISAGIVMLAGELLAFGGGTVQAGGTKLAVEETTENVTSLANVFAAYVTRRRAVVNNATGTVVLENMPRWEVSTKKPGDRLEIATTGSSQSGTYQGTLLIDRRDNVLAIVGNMYVDAAIYTEHSLLVSTGMLPTMPDGIDKHYFKMEARNNYLLYIDNEGNIRWGATVDLSVSGIITDVEIKFNAILAY